MSLKLITLNIEGNKHFKRVIPFLQSQKADVVCLQEVFAQDIPFIEKELQKKGEFFPFRFDKKKAPRDIEGILTLTNTKVKDVNWFTYYEQTSLKKNISALVHKIKKDDRAYTILNTHFTWTYDGNENNEQRDSWDNLFPRLQLLEDFILCGDFNAPRGRSMHTSFCSYLTDNLPPKIKTTLDSKYHRNPTLELAIDNIYSRGNHLVSKVKVHDELSDHMAISGIISKKEKKEK